MNMLLAQDSSSLAENENPNLETAPSLHLFLLLCGPRGTFPCRASLYQYHPGIAVDRLWRRLLCLTVIRIAGVVTDSPLPLQRVLMFRHGLEPSCRSYPLVGLCPEDTPAAFPPYMNTFIFELIVHRMLSVAI